MRALLFACLAGAVAAESSACPRVAPLFQIGNAYEADVQFSIPYYNFTEKAYVWGNMRNGGALRLSYNGGAAIFMQNNMSTHMVYNLHAAEQSFLCDATPFGAFNSPFPDLALFKPSMDSNGCQKTVMINGATASQFEFTFSDPVRNPHSDSTYNPPNEDGPGYVGRYYWYQDARSAVPVRFHTVVGHNVVFGGSHVDEYVVDYLSYTDSAEWPEDEFFLPPQGMPCTSMNNPFGPTATKDHHKARLQAWGKHEPIDFHSLFPEGAEHRRNIADAHAEAHSELLDGKTHSNHAVARLHTSARYVAGRNRQLSVLGYNYTVGLNGLAHLTHMERARRSGGFRATAHLSTQEDFVRISKEAPGKLPLGPGLPADECGVHTMSGLDLPDEVDLTKYTFPAKDQGTCGSCWSFGATGAIEGALWSTSGTPPKRASQQNLMDCSWYYGNMACDGGQDFTAYSFLLSKNQGTIATEEMYGPYLNKDGFCHYDLSRNWTKGDVNDVLSFTGCNHVNTAWQGNSPTDGTLAPSLRDALYNRQRPISVAIDATRPDFYYYTGGYYYDPTCANGLMDLDHEVLAVGYKKVGGDYYTRIKNSWSNHWGDQGFVWISQKDNTCGVATVPNYVLTAKDQP